MSKFSRWFVITGILFLFFSSLLGLSMALIPPLRPILRFSHIHMMMIGWVSMLIFGLSYHVLPRFCGKPQVGDTWQGIHWGLTTSGLIGMIGSPILKFTHPNLLNWDIVFFFFGCLQFLGILIFCFTMLRILDLWACPFTSHKKACCQQDKCK